MSDHNDSDKNIVEHIGSSINLAKEEILNKLNSKDPFWWKIVSIILPIVLKSIISFFIFKAQSDIQNTINEKASVLTMRLSLAQDLYKQRLKAYMELYDIISSVESSLKDPKSYSENRQQTQDGIEKLSNLSNSNKLLVSPGIFEILIKLWTNAAFSTKLMNIDNKSINDFSDYKDKIEKQMREDLFMDKLSLSEIITGTVREGQNR